MNRKYIESDPDTEEGIQALMEYGYATGGYEEVEETLLGEVDNYTPLRSPMQWTSPVSVIR